MTYDEARQELEDVIRRLLPDLMREESALLVEWTLIVGYTDPEEGGNRLDLVTGATTLISHNLGALRFAQIMLEEQIRETP